MQKFDLNADTKKIIQEIASTFGAQQDTVKKVWEYSLFTWILNWGDTSKPFDRIEIPFVGHIDLKQNGQIMTDGKLEPDVECWVSLSDEFKQLYSKVKNNEFQELSEYLEKNYIKKIAKNIVEDNTTT